MYICVLLILWYVLFRCIIKHQMYHQTSDVSSNISESCHEYMCILDTLYELFICVLKHQWVLPCIYVYCWYFIWIIHKFNLRSRSFAMYICVLLILWYELFRCIIKHHWVLPCIQMYRRYFDICHWYLSLNINDSGHMKSYTYIWLYDIFEMKRWLHICKLFGVCLYTLWESLWKERIITSSSHEWMLSCKTGHHVTATDLQHTLQHTCNTLQHTNAMWRSWHHHHMDARIPYRISHDCNTLQHTCNTLQHTATQWDDHNVFITLKRGSQRKHVFTWLQHAATHQQHPATHRQHPATHLNTLERTAKHQVHVMMMTSSWYWCKDLVQDTTLRDCNTLATHLQRPATHLQHTKSTWWSWHRHHIGARIWYKTRHCVTCNPPATHLQHPATHRQHTCNTLQHTKSKW